MLLPFTNFLALSVPHPETAELPETLARSPARTLGGREKKKKLLREEKSSAQTQGGHGKALAKCNLTDDSRCT